MFQPKPLKNLRPRLLTLCACLIAAPAFASAPATVSTPAARLATLVASPPASNTATSLHQQRLTAEQQRRQMQQVRRQRERLRRQMQIERRQLQQARRRLQHAAQQIAALSARLAGPAIQRAIHNTEWLTNPRQGLIGVQLDNSGGPKGADIRAVTPGGAAQQAGVRAGDVIVAVNGTALGHRDPTRRVVQLMRHVTPGENVTLRVLRDGKPRQFTMVAQPGMLAALFGQAFPPAPPAVPRAPAPPLPNVPQSSTIAPPPWHAPLLLTGPISDMQLVRLTPQLGRYFGTDRGVLVVRAPPHGALGLQDGDVILSIGQRRPLNSSQVIRILASYNPGDKITLHVLRRQRELTITTTLPTGSAMGHTV